MNFFLRLTIALGLVASATACQKADKKKEPAKDKAGETKDPTASRPTTTPDPHAKAKKDDIPAPDDVAAAPADAKKTENGVSYKVLTPGKADGVKPTVDDNVEVHYTGWTTDGKMFDSSVKRGKSTTFALKNVIPGWTEGLQVMSEGETTRFWIPEELAYKGQGGGSPAGMLVFDVELIKIIKAPVAPKDVSAPPASAMKTKLGVSYRVIESSGKKEKPNAWDRVKVDYTGWTASDGAMFDSSITRGKPAEFALDQVIPGWTEGLQLMSVGDKYLFWIPSELAYRNQEGRPKGMLVFEVSLLEIRSQPKPPTPPEDVAAPPKSAKKTDKGVSYRVLSKGKGGPKPKPTDKVEVHYSGWTTDGKMFDSSVKRGHTATFPLTNVIAGWTDGLQVMSVGDKVRFWIPEELAYGGKPGKPKGMLIFDVELVSIK